MRLFRNIRDFIVHHTFIFSVFFILLFSSICSVLYTVNFLNNLISNYKLASESERTYIISVSDPALDVKLDQLITEREKLSHVYCVLNNNGDAVIADYYGHHYGRDGVSFGRWFREEDFADGAKKVILPNYPYLFRASDVEYKRLNIGDSYEIGGIPYEAIGIGLLSEFVYQIPFRSIEDQSAIANVAIATEKNESLAEIQAFSAYLEELFHGSVIKQPEVKEDSASGRYSLEAVLIIGILSVSVFTLAYIYLYILDTRKKEIAIHRISGQTVFSGVMTAYAEILLISTIGYIVCALFMKLCLFPLLQDQGFLFRDSMDTVQYLMVYLVFIFIYSIVFLPAIIRYMKKPPFEAFTDI